MMLLCICTGNTCRSPMAAALLRRELERRGHPTVRVASAGLAADYSPATPQAIAVMAACGIDLTAHRSQPVTAELLEQADGIFVMTPSHRQMLLSVGVDPARVYLPDPPIPDPFGGDEEIYRRTRDALALAVADWVDTLFPAMTVRRMTAEDTPALAAIETACFAHPWSETALREEADNPTARFFVAEQGSIAGYAGMHIGGDEGFIDNVAVSPTHRRKGVGATLMAALLACGREEHLYRLTLEVRPSNTAAIALYEKLGFTRDGIRPGFYRDPTEDAAIYSYYYEKETPI